MTLVSLTLHNSHTLIQRLDVCIVHLISSGRHLCCWWSLLTTWTQIKFGTPQQQQQQQQQQKIVVSLF